MNTSHHDSHDIITALTPDTTDATVPRDLHDALAARADRGGILDVSYRSVDSPLGPLLVATTAAGLVRLAFESEGHDTVLEDLAVKVSPRILRSGRRTDTVAVQLDEYFTGRRRRFDLDIDLQLVSGFRHTVISELSSIAYGETASYATVAQRAGNPRAVRAVGSACAHNPVPVVVPCHRVVRSDGTIGNYRGGIDAKDTLLTMESQP